MSRKIRVALLCGGKSAEHEISLLSAQNIMNALDKKKYDVSVIRIDKKGRWFLYDKFRTTKQNKLGILHHSRKQVSYSFDTKKNLTISNKKYYKLPVDVVFPVLHGTYGEDGTIQGFLNLMNVPFVGAGVVGSSLGMDKDVMKRLLRDAQISVAKFLVYRSSEKGKITFTEVKKEIGIPCFVKPANLGSSIGITKAYTEKEFVEAVQTAFRYDTKIIIEEEIKGREIECSILGNEEMTSSLPGEVIVHDDFYSYRAKYIDKSGADLCIPAQLNGSLIEKIQKLAIQVATVLCVDGMARVDFFVTKNGEIFVNEINTIPGFTDVSMYPKLWEASGVSLSQLLDTLIKLAIAKHQRDEKLQVEL